MRFPLANAPHTNQSPEPQIGTMSLGNRTQAAEFRTLYERHPVPGRSKDAFWLGLGREVPHV
jgi:hypothetical protein